MYALPVGNSLCPAKKKIGQSQPHIDLFQRYHLSLTECLARFGRGEIQGAGIDGRSFLRLDQKRISLRTADDRTPLINGTVSLKQQRTPIFLFSAGFQKP